MNAEVIALGAATICYKLLKDTEVGVSIKSLKFCLKRTIGASCVRRGSNTRGRWNSSNYECKESKIVPKIEINNKALYCRKTPCELRFCYPCVDIRGQLQVCFYKKDEWKYDFELPMGSQEFYKDDNNSIELGKKQIMVCPVLENMEGDAWKVKDKICGAGFFVDLDTTNRTMPKKVKNAQKARYDCIIVVGEDKEEVGVIRRDKMGTRKMSLVNMLNFLRDEVGPTIP